MYCTRHFTLLPAALLLACMAPAEAEELLYDEEDERSQGGEAWIPEGTREAVAASTAPEIEPPIVAHVKGTPRYRMSGDGTIDDCVAVNSDGFPAIDESGTVVATSLEQWMQLSSFPGMTTLRLISQGGADEDRTISIVPDDAYSSIDRGCRGFRTQVRKDMRRANAELASRGFRTMEALAVEYGHTETPAEAYLETPARERLLQIIVQHGEAIVRIPGVKVYARAPVPATTSDSLYAVHGDRKTGTVVLTFADCMGDSCTCDPMFTAMVMHWDQDTFAALDAHPCADPDAKDGLCRGIDYGF